MTDTLEAPAASAGDPYREALEQVCESHREFAAFLRARVALNYRNAAVFEAKTGRVAHKAHAAAAEAQYLSQQFERTLA